MKSGKQTSDPRRGPALSVTPTLLLDTHIWIWLVEGTSGVISQRMVERLESAADGAALRVSAVSAWEVAMLVQKRRLHLARDPASWVNEALAKRGVTETRLNSTIAVAAASLPAPAPADPADRFLIATAFGNGWTFVTKDATILAYGAKTGIPVLDARN